MISLKKKNPQCNLIFKIISKLVYLIIKLLLVIMVLIFFKWSKSLMNMTLNMSKQIFKWFYDMDIN